MPRFTSLSSVIANQIAKTVPSAKMPDGSAVNTFVGNVPLTTEYNIKQSTEVFRWGISTWGVEDITSEHAPKTT